MEAFLFFNTLFIELVLRLFYNFFFTSEKFPQPPPPTLSSELRVLIAQITQQERVVGFLSQLQIHMSMTEYRIGHQYIFELLLVTRQAL